MFSKFIAAVACMALSANAASTTNATNANRLMDPRVVARNGGLAFEVDGGSDIIMSRIGKDTTSIFALADKSIKAELAVAASMVQADLKIKQGLESTTSKLTALFASRDNATTKLVEDKLTPMSNKISEALRKMTSTDTTLKAAMKELSTTMGKSVDAKLKDIQTKLTTADAAIKTEMTAKLAALEGNARCSFQGTYDTKTKKCKCNTVMISGLRCEKQVLKSCNGAATGATKIAPDGKNVIDTYCNGDLDGGGWELIINLVPKKAPSMKWSHTFWTETGKTMGSTSDNKAIMDDFKSGAFNTRNNNKEIMIVGHQDGKTLGYAVWNVASAYQGKTMSELFRGCGSGCAYSNGARKKSSGQIKNQLTRNTNRPQSLHGDIFLDYNHPLVINKRSGWSAGRNWNRLATTLSNGNYAHTFAGIGGRHEQGVGSWITDYESSPIYAYCDGIRGYGNDNVWKGGAGQAFGSCKNGGFKWVDVSHSIYLR